MVAVAKTSAEPFVPAGADLPELSRASSRCQGCELYLDATQTVFGEGPPSSRLVLIGEQPGDVEDREGHPFVGPAGRILDRALAEAGIERESVWLTNAVKHFRWKSTESSTRRLHAKPDARHVTACRPWLVAELQQIQPAGVVALGATAAQSLFGSAFRLTQHRGEKLSWPPERGPFADDDSPIEFVIATLHPSAILRADPSSRERDYQGLVEDLRLAAS
ncbi:MAG TPA: UdgX family uracil-DNA binding protein [Jatrophihabitans sp.]|nr:UdgX family uracil-DNA binding protein [Jatrophihabitans sp.]